MAPREAANRVMNRTELMKITKSEEEGKPQKSLDETFRDEIKKKVLEKEKMEKDF